MEVSEAEQRAPALVIALFGPFDIRLGDQPLPQLRARKSQSLLALLVLQHRRQVERSWLAGTLWPDASQSQALFYLRRSLTELRHALGPEARRLGAGLPRIPASPPSRAELRARSRDRDALPATPHGSTTDDQRPTTNDQ